MGRVGGRLLSWARERKAERENCNVRRGLVSFAEAPNDRDDDERTAELAQGDTLTEAGRRVRK